MMLIKILIFLTYLLPSGNQTRKDFLKSDWKALLSNYVIQNSKKHDAMIIFEKEEFNHFSKANDILPITSSFPSVIYRVPELFTLNKNIPKTRINPGATTLFIIIFSSTQFNASEPIKFLTRISNVQARPKCLIIHILKDKHITYRNFLQDCWRKKFLDVTVLQLFEKTTSENILLALKKESTIHYFNPFTKVYTKKRFSGNYLFPEKTRNLHKQTINILGINRYNVDLNISESAFESYGSTLALFKVFSKSMNFEMNITRAFTRKEYGKEGCFETNFTGLVRGLLRNEFQIILNRQYPAGSCYATEPFLRSRTISLESVMALIPKVPEENSKISIGWHWIFILIANVSVFGFILTMAHVLKFEKKFWEPLDIFRVILAMCAPLIPKNTGEKIVFGCMILISVVYSSYLHLFLTNINLRNDPGMVIDTLEDLDKSGLVLFVDESMHNLPTAEPLGGVFLENLRRKSQTFSDTFTRFDCFEALAKYEYKNISCALSIASMQVSMKKCVQQFVEIELKIVHESLMPGPLGFMLEPGSLYAQRFDELLLKLVENGLLDKWEVRGTIDLRRISRKKQEAQTVKLKYLLISILIFGYMLSCIIFAGEVIVDYFDKKRERIMNVDDRICSNQDGSKDFTSTDAATDKNICNEENARRSFQENPITSRCVTNRTKEFVSAFSTTAKMMNVSLKDMEPEI